MAGTAAAWPGSLRGAAFSPRRHLGASSLSGSHHPAVLSVGGPPPRLRRSPRHPHRITPSPILFGRAGLENRSPDSPSPRSAGPVAPRTTTTNRCTTPPARLICGPRFSYARAGPVHPGRPSNSWISSSRTGPPVMAEIDLVSPPHPMCSHCPGRSTGDRVGDGLGLHPMPPRRVSAGGVAEPRTW